MENKRNIGNEKEDQAVEFLANQGFNIISRNYHCRFAELDIVAVKNDLIIFVEVKYRHNSKKGMPFEAVDYNKSKRITKAAVHFISKYKEYASFQMRFDVISILGNDIDWIKNAFLSSNNFFI